MKIVKLSTTSPGLAELKPGASLAEIEAACRRLVVEVSGLDPLAREIRRESARQDLIRLKYYAPARLLQATLGPGPADVGKLLGDVVAGLERLMRASR